MPSLNDMKYENVERKKRIVRETRPDGTVIEIEEVIENHTLAGVGVKMLQAQLQNMTLMRVLGVGLATSTSETHLRSELGQLMYDVHDRIPIKESDMLGIKPVIADKKVFVLTRNTPNSSSNWIELPGVLGLNRLVQHACDLYSFLMECGVQRLHPSTFQNLYVVLSFIGGTDQALVVALLNNEIVTQYSDVKNLTPCPLDKTKDAEELMGVVQARKLEVIDKLMLMPDNSDDLFYINRDVENFICRTKPKKTPGHISVLEIQN